MDVALLRQALEKHEQNLATLEVQKANYGIAVPAYCLIHKSNHSAVSPQRRKERKGFPGLGGLRAFAVPKLAHIAQMMAGNTIVRSLMRQCGMLTGGGQRGIIMQEGPK